MANLNKEKHMTLLKIERAKAMLDCDIKNNLINEEEIYELFKNDSNFVLSNPKAKDNKLTSLIQIYNCPFLLFDQNLSLELKKELIIFAKKRYEMELNELDRLFSLDYISQEEYIYDKEMIKFCYYKSSKEGKSILNKSQCKKLIKQI